MTNKNQTTPTRDEAVLDHERIPTWPPLKKALWDVVTGEKLNDGHYINAYQLTDKLYAAATPVSEAGGELHHASGERITRKDLNDAYRKGAEDGRLATKLIDGMRPEVLAKPASSPADVVQTLIDKTEKLIEAADDMAWSCNSSSADQAIREARDAVRAALFQSTSAGRGE